MGPYPFPQTPSPNPKSGSYYAGEGEPKPRHLRLLYRGWEGGLGGGQGPQVPGPPPKILKEIQPCR